MDRVKEILFSKKITRISSVWNYSVMHLNTSLAFSFYMFILCMTGSRVHQILRFHFIFNFLKWNFFYEKFSATFFYTLWIIFLNVERLFETKLLILIFWKQYLVAAEYFRWLSVMLWGFRLRCLVLESLTLVIYYWALDSSI